MESLLCKYLYCLSYIYIYIYIYFFYKGHTRYSTSGSSEPINCQPFVVETLHGRIATAHNGELVNASRLKQKVNTLLLLIL